MAPAEVGAPATSTDERLAARLADYCRSRRPQADHLEIIGLARIFGGASRETWRFVMRETVRGQTLEYPLILRRDPQASLIDTDRRVEFAAYQAFADSEVPVPRPWWLETDPAVLGHPFFVMERVTGCEAAPMALMAEPYLSLHAAIARRKWTLLGRIATTDPAVVGNVLAPVDTGSVWQRELDHWAATIEREAREAQPVAMAAIRWLRRHPPPPAQRLSIVHGDYRTGNFLVSPQGEIRAILDWEMMHLGDPLEDLAWGLNRSWAFGNDELAGGLAPRERAIAWWEAASGLRAEPHALHWWELFSCVKGQGIWLAAAAAFDSGANRDLMMAFAAWLLGNDQDRSMLALMGHLR